MAATTPNGSAISRTLRSIEPIDDAHGLHGRDELVYLTRGEQVLLDLVRDNAVAGLLDGQPGQRLRVRRHGIGHRRYDSIDLFLAELGKERLCLFRGAREGPRL